MSVKLEQFQCNYRLRNNFGIRVSSLIYCFKKSWHRLRIKEMIKWRRFCGILKRLNVINVNSEYCVKCVNILFCLRFIHYKDVLFKNYDLRSSNVKKKLNSDVKIRYPTF